MVEGSSSSSKGNVIVVGVDGSDQAGVAALWAAAEAHRRNASLCIVHGATVLGPNFVGDEPLPSEVHDAGRRWAQRVLDKAAGAVRSDFPALAVTSEIRDEPPLDALLALSESVLMVVVGSSGSNQLVHALVGSVAARLAALASGPVVVVRSDTESELVPEDGPVVLGLDGSPDSTVAMQFAFEEASLRGVALQAVHSWDDTGVEGFLRAYPLPIDEREIEDEHRRLLSEQLAGWSSRFPEVAVERVVRRGRPVAALLTETDGAPRRAQLVVVGSRGRGRFAGILLGSTSQALIANAHCPVAVLTGDGDDQPD